MTVADLVADLDTIEAELARRHLHDFVRQAWPIVEPDTPFLDNWHIRALCRHLEAVTRGDLARLLINVPPGTAKSLIVSVFWPCWEWATNPARRFLCASYGESLAVRDNLKARAIATSPWYQRAFDLRLRSDQNMKQRFDTVQTGWRIGTSVGGRATGEHPDVVIIDDPHTAQEAESEAERQRAADWFDRTISSRGVGRNARIVVIMQRLHELDLSGHLLAKGGWTHLRWPMRFEPDAADPTDERTEPGALLWPALFPEDAVAQLERDLGSYGTAGQLQQRPAPAEGGLLKRGWWRWYAPGDPPRQPDEIVISWDTALRSKQTNDYTSGQAWARQGPNSYALRMVRGRWDFPELVQQMGDVIRWVQREWPSVYPTIVIENAGAGPEAIAELRRTFGGVMAENPKGDKRQRVHAVTPIIEAGNVYLPGVARGDGSVETTLSPAWVDEFVEECAAFPFGAHDDQVDALTQALRRLHRPKTFMVATTLAGW